MRAKGPSIALLAALGLGLGPVSPASAEDDALRIGGRVGTSLNLGLHGCSSASTCQLLNFRNSNVLGLTLEARPSRTVDVVGGILIRNVNFARIETLEDTGEISEVQPIDVRPLESKVLLTDLFGAEGLELVAGMVRIAWGTADGVSPTDIVNPYDMERGAGFENRLPSLAIGMAYEVQNFRLEATLLPLFSPALLPIEVIDVTTLGEPSQVFDLAAFSSGEPPAVRQVETPTTTPEPSAKNLQAGVRARYRTPAGDVSLMFYRGFESLPQASGEARLSGFQTSNRVDLGVPLAYPRVMMAGADWRGPVAGPVSAWVDLGVFFPEAQRLTASASQLQALVSLGRLDSVPDPIPSQETQSSDVYVKAVAGLDATFAEVVYTNLQYAYGLPLERQRSDLHHYVLGLVRVSLLDDRLELLAQGGIEVADPDTLGFQAGGSVTWVHGDAARLSLGVTFVGGQSGSTFGRLERLSNLHLGVETRF